MTRQDNASWRTWAACRDADPELFAPRFPSEVDWQATAATARTWCGPCPVRAQCDTDAAASPSRSQGLWAGVMRMPSNNGRITARNVLLLAVERVAS